MSIRLSWLFHHSSMTASTSKKDECIIGWNEEKKHTLCILILFFMLEKNSSQKSFRRFYLYLNSHKSITWIFLVIRNRKSIIWLILISWEACEEVKGNRGCWKPLMVNHAMSSAIYSFGHWDCQEWACKPIQANGAMWILLTDMYLTNFML